MGEVSRFQHGVKIGTDGDTPTEISMVKKYTVTFDPATIGANSSAEKTVAVTGLNVGDIPILVKPTCTAGIGIGNVRVSAANTLAVTFVNASSSDINPASESYTVLVFTPGTD